MKLFINEIIVDGRIRKIQNRAEKGAHHYSVPGRSCEPLGHQTN